MLSHCIICEFYKEQAVISVNATMQRNCMQHGERFRKKERIANTTQYQCMGETRSI